MDNDPRSADLRLDADNLYREETFTDQKVGVIRRLVPVRADGSEDTGRSVLFSGQTSLMTPMGALPLSFEIEAGSLAEAISKFPETMKVAVQQTMEEMRELRRQAASSIVVPDVAGGGLGGPSGGGKIQLR